MGDGESTDEDSEFTLASDFEIGHFFHEWIVPGLCSTSPGRPSRMMTILKKAKKERRRNWKVMRRKKIRLG